mmetsp:Transcript_34181/g.68925  ORF Transcript_34181/g.68925 Transcript_34181/m.68925 type:complete len:544 (-) Transcript_34181:2735-4366(-)
MGFFCSSSKSSGGRRKSLAFFCATDHRIPQRHFLQHVYIYASKRMHEPLISHHRPPFSHETESYTMIDTCDPSIASWSEDGKTFVVKNITIFASTIIPQFFKHSKWSSFVRQLNFYGFRKIKYADTLRIDIKLEAETANYWKFKHDKFQRGRPDLLVEIKRHRDNQAAAAAAAAQKSEATPVADGSNRQASSSAPAVAVVDPTVKSEVKELRDRIAAMSKNIDDLTSMVHNIKVQDDNNASAAVAANDHDHAVGSKRKKIGGTTTAARDSGASDMLVDEVTSCGGSGIDSIAFTPGSIFPTPAAAVGMSRQSSTISDDAFVDDLFNFDEAGLLDLTSADHDQRQPTVAMLEPEPEPVLSTPMAPPSHLVQEKQSGTNDESNRPDPKLMKELTDALTLLPREMQEMLVNRLISTIISTESLKSHIDAVSTTGSSTATSSAAAASTRSSTAVVENDEASFAAANRAVGSRAPVVAARERQAAARLPSAEERQNTVVVAASPDNKPEIALQLDPETLNALLAQYTEAMKHAGKNAGTKTLPIIAVH